MNGMPVVNKEIFELDDSESNDEKDAKQVRGRPFEKGTSGNPEGKRPGTRNAATLANEALIDGQSEAVIQIVIKKALAEDMAAIRLLFDRILPARRERLLQFELPLLKTGEDAVAAISTISEGVGKGELSASEAQSLVNLVHTFLEARAQIDFEQRVTKLEEIKSAIEEKALDVREQNTPHFPLGFFKKEAVE